VVQGPTSFVVKTSKMTGSCIFEIFQSEIRTLGTRIQPSERKHNKHIVTKKPS
jgi:hypothetical protein